MTWFYDRLIFQLDKYIQGPGGNDSFSQRDRNGILLPKLLWPTVRKIFSSDPEKLLKFEAEGWEFSKILRLLEQFIQTVKGQDTFW